MLKSTPKGKKNKIREDNFDALYHNCRWCKYYDKSKGCIHPSILESKQDYLYNTLMTFSEDGVIQETVKETLTDSEWIKFADKLVTQGMLELKLSGSKAQKLRQIFFNIGEEYIMNVSESVDNALLINLLENNVVEGEEILEPEYHCCDYWE